MKYAEKSFEEKDFYGASLYYREAMLIDSSNLYVVYKYAESLRHYNDYLKAEEYYRYVFLRDNKQYPEAQFWMAMMQKNNAKYVEARKNFISYSKTCKDKDSYSFRKSQQEIRSCAFALELSASPAKYVVYNLGDSLNTTNAEFAAVKVNDSAFYFSALEYQLLQENKKERKHPHVISIFHATLHDTLWERKSKLDSVINKANTHNANGCFSPDGKQFYFTRCPSGEKCRIFVSELEGDRFKTAQPLEETINHPSFAATQPNVAVINGSEVLFFVSDRENGVGQLDIWYSVKKGGAFEEPQNAGPAINTIEDDICPYYDTTGHFLYFSSPWHFGLGGFDIHKSSGTPGSFTAPENVGNALNSSANDLYFSYENRTGAGFLTSNRKGAITNENITCCNDLWAFRKLPEPPKKDTLVPVAKVNPLEDLKKYLPIKLYFHNDEPNPKTRDTLTRLTYTETLLQYKALIPEYRENYSKGLRGDKKQAAEDSIQSFFDHQVLRNYAILDTFAGVLLHLLNKGYKLDLTVKGHASPLAKTEYNVPLTLRRISSLENFLETYRNGVLKPYLLDSASNGGSLKIIRVPFGEYKAEKQVSDNLNDRKNSVYSIGAAVNRNIEIVSVSLEQKDSLAARIAFRKEIYDFGNLKQGSKVSHTFRFRNTGKATLLIQSIETSCPCITAKASATSLAPGERGEIEVTFDTTGLSGKQVQTITLVTNGIPDRKELSVTAEVR